MKKILLLLSLICSLANGQILTNFQGKIISKNGMVMGAPEGVVFVTAQPATLNQVTVSLRLDPGKTVYIKWGNGDITTISGSGANEDFTSTYSGNNSTYIIQLTGDIDFIKRFGIDEPTVKFSSTASLSKLTRLEELVFNTVSFSSLNLDALSSYLTIINLSFTQGSVFGDITLRTGLTYLRVAGPNTVTGSITNLTNATYLVLTGSATLSGSVTNLVNLTEIVFPATSTVTGSVTNLVNLTRIVVSGTCSISGSVTYLTNLTNLNVIGNSIVTGDISNLINVVSLSLQGASYITGSINNLHNLNYLQAYSPSTILTGNIENLRSDLYLLQVSANCNFSGSVTNFTNLYLISIPGPNSLSGVVNNLTKIASLVILGSSSLSQIQNLTALTSVTSISLSNSVLTTVTPPNSTANLSTCYLYGNNIDKFDFTNTLNLRGDLRIYSNPNDTSLVLPATLTGDFTRIDAHGNALNQRSVNEIFSRLSAYYATRTPSANLYIDVSGGTNSAPTGGWSNPDIVALDTKFSSAGKILTIIKN